jgi:transcriptional regulator with XRE-family HTH domain
MAQQILSTGETIKLYRDKRGLTQAALALKAKITNVQLCRIERGRVAAKTETLRKIAAALRVPLRELL